jgi:hypothetical protein
MTANVFDPHWDAGQDRPPFTGRRGGHRIDDLDLLIAKGERLDYPHGEQDAG